MQQSRQHIQNSTLNKSLSKVAKRTEREERKGDAKPINIALLMQEVNVPKSFRFIPTDNASEQLSLAKNLMSFVKLNFNEAYNSLSFDTNNDTLDTLISELANIVFNNDKFFEVLGDTTLFLTNDVTFNTHLYVVDISDIFNLPNRPLKIGFAHLIASMNRACSNFNLKNTLKLKSLESSHLEDVMLLNEDDDSEQAFSKKDIAKHLIEVNKTLNSFHRYFNEDITIFENYKPKSKANKALKALINNGLDIDFSAVHRFAEDTSRDEALSFYSTFKMIFNNDNFIEQASINMDLERGNEIGVSQPCSIVAYDNGVLNYQTSDCDRQSLIDITKFFIDLNSFPTVFNN